MRALHAVSVFALVLAGCGDEALRSRHDPGATVLPPVVAPPPGTWSTSAEVHALEGLSVRPIATLDQLGNALIVWEHRPVEPEGWKNIGLRASRHDGSSWSPPVLIAAGYDWIYDVRLVGSDNGDAHLLWSGRTTAGSHVAASRFTVSTGWSAPVQLDQDAGAVRLVIDGYGRAIAVWHIDSNPEALVSRVYDPAAGWQPPETLVSAEIDAWWESFSTLFDLAVSPAGDAILVWSQRVVGATEVWARRGSPSTAPSSWAPAEQLVRYEQERAVSRLWAHMTGDGIVSVVWNAYDEGTSYSLEMTQASAGVPFSSPSRIAGPIPRNYGSFENQPQVEFSRTGEVIALWREEREGTGSIVSRHLRPMLGWDEPSVIVSGLELPLGCTLEGNAEAVTVGLDETGSAVVVWETLATDTWAIGLQASEFTRDGGWGAPVPLTPGATGSAQAPSVRLAPAAGLTLWIHAGEVAGGGWAERMFASRLERVQ